VKLDQGNADAARVNVDYANIVSPIDGRVGLRQVDLGNIVQANGTTPLATVTQLQPITVIFALAEDHISDVVEQMKTGRKLKVIAMDRSLTKTLSSGVLLALDNQIDVTTGTVKVRATFKNEKNELFPNQFVNARLQIKTLQNVTLVPTSAVQLNDAKSFVYVVKDDSTVEAREIKILATEGEVSAISEVSDGEMLVTDGFDRLQKGTKVTVKQPGAKPMAGAAPKTDDKSDTKPTGDK
jgi:multidrug efflux system membrane fusion protein